MAARGGSRADSTAEGASWGGVVGAYYGYLRGVMSGPSPGFSNSRAFRNAALAFRNIRGSAQAGSDPSIGPQINVPRDPNAAPGYVTRPSTGYPAGYVPPPKTPPPPKGPSAADKYPLPPGLPPIFRGVWGTVVAYAVLWALPYIYKKASESWSEYFARWQDREEQHRKQMNRRRAGGPPGAGTPRARAPRARAPQMPPGQWDDMVLAPSTPLPPQVTVIVQAPTTPRAPPRADEGLSVPTIYRQRVPVPSMPPATVPLWKQLTLAVLPTAIPALSKLLGTGSGKRTRLRDPLTLDQGPAVSYDPRAFSQVNPFGSFGSGTPSKACECPKKKRGKRKLRTVCYKGSYVETAKGIKKRKREQVSCQA